MNVGKRYRMWKTCGEESFMGRPKGGRRHAAGARFQRSTTEGGGKFGGGEVAHDSNTVAAALVSTHGTAFLMGGARSRGPARCLILEARGEL